MKTMYKHFVRYAASLTLASAASLPHVSLASETCLTSAAGEFGIPIRILEAMRTAAAAERPANSEFSAREFGPMSLGDPAIHRGAKALGMSKDRVKTEACANYRVSAWLLDQARRDAGGDFWVGLQRYRVGNNKSSHALEVADRYVATIKNLSGNE